LVITEAEPQVAGANIEALARINADTVLDALGLAHLRRGRRTLRRLIRLHTIHFARTLASYDAEVGQRGLGPGAIWLLERFIGKLEISGQCHVPRSGPLLVLANHPGLSDTLALIASIPRDDLRILAADRPFLRALPRTSERLVYLGERSGQRFSALRDISAHLREGGAMLTFPAGRIEPDPLLQPEAALRLEDWDESLRVVTRIARNIPVVPAIVSGVLSPAAQGNPITWLRRRQADREWLGCVLQTVLRSYQQVTVRVAFGPAMIGEDPGCESFITRIMAAERQLVWTELPKCASL
jgi:hypothetical protein